MAFRAAPFARPLPHRGLPLALPEARWGLGELRGRLVELSGTGLTAALTVAAGLVREAQRAREPAAWLTGSRATFFPPDLAASGVDCGALVVVRAEEARAALRAADRLLRSGAFGLVVVDLGRARDLPLATQTRLAGLAQRHATALLLLTDKADDAPSLGSLVTLRASVRSAPLGDGRFACEVRALKDKRRGPGWIHREVCRGPTGLR